MVVRFLKRVGIENIRMENKLIIYLYRNINNKRSLIKTLTETEYMNSNLFIRKTKIV